MIKYRYLQLNPLIVCVYLGLSLVLSSESTWHQRKAAAHTRAKYLGCGGGKGAMKFWWRTYQTQAALHIGLQHPFQEILVVLILPCCLENGGEEHYRCSYSSPPNQPFSKKCNHVRESQTEEIVSGKTQ